MHVEELKHRRSAAEPRGGVAVGSEQLVAALQEKRYLEVVLWAGCVHDWAWRIYRCLSMNPNLFLIVFLFNVSRLRALLFWKSYVSGYLVSSSVPEPFIALCGIIKTLSHILSLSFPHIDFASAFWLFTTRTLYTWPWKKERTHKFQLVNTVGSGTVFQFGSEGEKKLTIAMVNLENLHFCWTSIKWTYDQEVPTP